MADSVFGNRVQEDFTTTGTGTITLAGASSGFQTFNDGITSSGTAEVQYTLFDSATNDFEVGVGTYTATGTTLSRDTILDSSNAGSAVNFAAGTKVAFVTLTADRFMARHKDTTTSVYRLKDFSSEAGADSGSIDVTSSTITLRGETNRDIIINATGDDGEIKFQQDGTNKLTLVSNPLEDYWQFDDTVEFNQQANFNNTVDFFANASFQDNDRLQLGNTDDLSIYHSGANFFDAAGTTLTYFRSNNSTRILITTSGVTLYQTISIVETENLRPINMQTKVDATNYTSTTSSLYTGDVSFTPQRTNSRFNLIVFASIRYVENSDDPGAYFRTYYYNNSDVSTIFPNQPTDAAYIRGRYADRGSANYIYGTPGTIVTHDGTDTTGGFLTSDFTDSSGNVRVRILVNGVGGTATDTLNCYDVKYMFIESALA